MLKMYPKIKFFLIFIYLLFCNSCLKQGIAPETVENNKNIQSNQKISNQKIFYLKVDGIECAYCVDLVFDILRSIEGVIDVQFEFETGTYEDKIKVTYIDDENFNKESIKLILEDEGFIVNLFS